MNFRFNSTSLLAAAAALIVLQSARPASAAMLSYGHVFDGVPVSILANMDTSLPKFDTNLGTLNSITLELDASDSTFDAVYTDTSGMVSEVNFYVGAAITMTAPSGITLTGTPSENGFNAALPPLQSITVMGNDSVIDEPQIIFAGLFAPYEAPGGGSFNLDGGATLSIAVMSGTGTVNPGTVDAGAFLQVTYDYTPVPEPATWLLASLGASGLWFVRRRSPAALKSS